MEFALKQTLGENTVNVCKIIGRAAHDFNENAYLVGGIVRDAFLGIHSSDIDFLLLKDCEDFLNFLRENWSNYFPEHAPPKKPTVFKKYRTAKLRFLEPLVEDVKTIDFSAARKETYSRPGAAPEVVPGDLETDLARRDFSVNAMAVSFSPDDFGTVIDNFNGKEDCANRQLRVLHADSFQDDPVRVIRAARFVARFKFGFEEETWVLFNKAIGGNFLSFVPKSRVFDEFIKGLKEENVADVLHELQRFDVLEQIHPKLSFSPTIKAIVSDQSEFQKTISGEKYYDVEGWEIVLALLFLEQSSADYVSILEEFEMPKKKIVKLVTIKENW